MTKRYIPAARVSTREQGDHGTSLETQIAACVQYIERIGGVALPPIAEDVSGVVPLYERAKGKQILDLLDKHAADGIVWYTVDRFYRDDLEARIQTRQWLRAGNELHFVDTGPVKSESDIVFLLRTWQASDERNKIRERTSRGRYAKARKGKVIGAGIPPYGYRFAEGQLEVVDEEARIVQRIFQWYAFGDEDGNPMPCFSIARRLSELGIPTAAAKYPKRARNRISGDGIWRRHMVDNILKRETYIGKWRFGLRANVNGAVVKRPLSETVEVSVPAIISTELWKAAQDQRAYYKRMCKRNAKRQYLLRGMITCGCGARFSGLSYKNQQGKKYYYYCCGADVGRFVDLEGRRCRQRSVRVEVLDSIVWNYLLHLMTDPNEFENDLRQAQAEELDSLGPKSEQLALVKESILRCESDARSLTASLKRVPPGGLMSAAIQKDIDRIELDYSSLCNKRDALETELNAKMMSDEDIQAALKFREDAIVGLQNPAFEDKRQMLEMLAVSVVVKDKQATVSCCIPGSEYTFDVTSSR